MRRRLYPLWCHLGDGDDRKRERCREVSRVICDSDIVGYFLVYVDDIIVVSRTKWILATMESLGTLWECKIVGILVADDDCTDLAVQSLVFLSITIELCPWWNDSSPT